MGGGMVPLTCDIYSFASSSALGHGRRGGFNTIGNFSRNQLQCTVEGRIGLNWPGNRRCSRLSTFGVLSHKTISFQYAQKETPAHCQGQRVKRFNR